jgi:FkbM family methyltransferase
MPRLPNLVARRWAYHILQKCSDFHIQRGRPQLAVFAFDDIAHLINLDGMYESDELGTLTKWLDQNTSQGERGIAIDVGANIGNHSVVLSKLFASVHAYEPNPDTFDLLSINVRSLGNVTCFPVGLSNRDGTAHMEVNARNIGASRLIEQPELTRSVEVRRLDSYATERVSLMKIDVEGHEWHVIDGARKTILRDCPLILFEQRPSDFANGSPQSIDLLIDLGYDEFLILKQSIAVNRIGNRYARMIIHSFLDMFGLNKLSLEPAVKIEPGFHPFIIARKKTVSKC